MAKLLLPSDGSQGESNNAGVSACTTKPESQLTNAKAEHVNAAGPKCAQSCCSRSLMCSITSKFVWARRSSTSI